MTTRLVLFAALAVALAASCGGEDDADGLGSSATGAETGESGALRTVTLTADAPETRVGMTKKSNSEASLYWHSSDSIYVQTVKGGEYGGAKFSAVSGSATGSKSAKFTGEIASGTELGTYAVYPYNENHSFTSATKLSYNLPSTYTYNTVESRIFSKTVDDEPVYPSNSTNIPMLGTIADNKISFKMLGGLAVIRIDSMPGTDGTLTVTADQRLCGDFTIEDVSATNAAIATDASATNNSVTFTFTGATADGTGVFFLPLATGNYTGVTVAITCGGTTQTVTYGNLNVARCSVTAIAIYSSGGTLYTKDSNGYYIIDGHAFVDLGLSSGILWATTNVGATLPADYGNYYAWAETETKSTYALSNYGYGATKMTKYNSSDKRTTLEASDDAATANWGSCCRTPSEAELEEISTSCKWTWTQLTNSQGESIYGYCVASKADSSQFVFLPCAGFHDTNNTLQTGTYGFYWSSTLDKTESDRNKAYYLSFCDEYSCKIKTTPRRFGQTVRPVTSIKASGK